MIPTFPPEWASFSSEQQAAWFQAQVTAAYEKGLQTKKPKAQAVKKPRLDTYQGVDSTLEILNLSTLIALRYTLWRPVVI